MWNRPSQRSVLDQARRLTLTDTITLTDHDEIRAWTAARAGFPAIVDVSPETGIQAVLTLVFGQRSYQDQDQAERPENAGGYELVEWDEWFKLFDDRKLALVVAAEEPGQREEFHELIRRADR
jgi:hypothetical protein